MTKEQKKTVIINLYGGPGTGKSTMAAAIFFEMKARGLNVELVREFVKDWAWEGRKIKHNEQIYIFAKQAFRESIFYGKVDYVVTDSPLFLSEVYESHYFGNAKLTGGLYKKWLQANKDEMISVNYFLNRPLKYQQEGRYETEEEAKMIDNKIKSALKSQGIPFKKVNTINGEKKIVDDLLTSQFDIINLL